MRFSSYSINGTRSWGLIEGEEIVDLAGLAQDLKSAIAGGLLGNAAETAKGAPRTPLSDIAWLPVIPNPDKILCVGLNYEMHRQETGRSEVANPTIFARYANSQTGHLADIIRPKVSTDLDFEGELVIVIGKAGRYISPSDALSYVAGYSLYNDGSVRDFQRHTHQFTPGKNFPETGAFGPWMMTPDEFGTIGPQRLRTRVNGEVVQDARLDQMIFDVPRIIEYCSSFTRLEPGDVIATGTPGGVGAKRNPPLWLKPGDTVEVEVSGLGVLRNGVADET
jgi:2-keto-4-pentenoate hydratase/2-oxohepta-3-ene-1,7-dioic acid hydratase in catechol pathway